MGESLYQRRLKRVFETVAVGTSAPIWMSVAAVIYLLILTFDRHSPIYRQVRVGLGGVTFVILKFRTMRDGDGPDEERITPLGRFLRKCRLDEILQLINVLRGEMSIVGPRPGTEDICADVLQDHPDFARRYEVLPGLTGLAQIDGVTLEKKNGAAVTKLDCAYVDGHSFMMDLGIIFNTLPVILGRNRKLRAADEESPRLRAVNLNEQGAD